MLPPAVFGRMHRPPRVGSYSDDDEPPRGRPPSRAGSSFSHSSRGCSPHHPQGYGGGEGGRGVGQSQSQPRANSLNGSGLMSPGGQWLRAPPLAAQSATIPPATKGTSRGRGRGQGRGRASLAYVFGFISAALSAAALAVGTQGGLPPPRKREQQGAAGRLRAGQGPGAPPFLSEQGQQSAAGHVVLQAQGQPEGATLGHGCQGQGQGQGQGGSPLPPARRSPPPPSLRGRARQAQERGNATRGGGGGGGVGQRVGQTVSGAPRSTGVQQPVCRPAGGGLLSLGFTRQVPSSGGGGAQPSTAAPALALAGADGGVHSPGSG